MVVVQVDIGTRKKFAEIVFQVMAIPLEHKQFPASFIISMILGTFSPHIQILVPSAVTSVAVVNNRTSLYSMILLIKLCVGCGIMSLVIPFF